MMNAFVAELTGTALLILLGNGVVANVVLHQTKGNSSGWIVITLGWAMAVFTAVFVASASSGAHLNPAVTIALALKNNNWSLVSTYIPAQMTGAMLGSFLVWLMYRQHFDSTDNSDLQRACFCTAPAIHSPINNFVSEMLGTFVLILGILFLTGPAQQLGSVEALPVALLVLAIGLSLGGTTGYAINPARDLAPRLVHAIVPIKNKGGSQWNYAWIPVIAPIAGAILAVLVYKLITILPAT
jgi:glycerol uptake facilitator protein